MEYLPLSFLAGLLTVLAPCVFPLLPVIIGGSVSVSEERDTARPFLILSSLALSLMTFSLLLKASSVAIDIDPRIWRVVSGLVVIFFGVMYLFPHLWERISLKLGYSTGSNALLAKSAQKKGWIGSVLIGAALGPVFASCSPTFGLIVAVILPKTFVPGFLNLLAYVAGLCLLLLTVSILGRKIVTRLNWAVRPDGLFKRSLGVLFLAVGVAVLVGWDKKLEAGVMGAGYFDTTKIEWHFLKAMKVREN